MDNDDNFESQEGDAERVDCKEEDTTRSNEFGDIKKSSKKSQSNGEAGTSRSLGPLKKDQLEMDIIKYGHKK